ncbi:MAG TPA: type VII secretion protein EccCa [Streptosporangiaceae bacterium]|nr:type VII secretion protein EccCa [Streptosporangiaceae bacterium]
MAGQAKSAAEQAGWSDAFRVHRPERSWPHSPVPAPIELIAPPAPPDGGTGRLASVLPMLGSLAMVGLAFLIHSLIYLVVIGGMVLAMVGGGLAASLSQRRSRARRWARTRQRYAAHLTAARAQAAAAALAQRDAAQACFPDPEALCTVAARGDGLWERRPGDKDFAAVRLGRGRVPADCPVRILRDEGPLAEADPDLAAEAERLIADTASLPAAPVVIGLREAGCIAIVGDPERSRALAGAWLASLATFHAPAELRIMGLVPLSAVRTWGWLKWLPHTRDPEAGEGLGRVSRAVTADPVAFGAQFESLAQRRLDSLRRRAEASAGLLTRQDLAGLTQRRSDAESAHIIVVIDGYRPGEGPPSLDSLMPVAADVAMTVIVLVGDMTEVPASCGGRVDWIAPGNVRYVASGPEGRVEAGVIGDSIDLGVATQLARTLAPLGLRSGETGADLADPVRLVELLGVDEAEQLDLRAQWMVLAKLADGIPPEFLAVPIGRKDNGAPLMLDFKEAAAGGMGPHGMLVGATGSGKSELLRSLTAAVAARHDPSLVNLLLIDFKGGAAFAGLAHLPHVAGLVTNLADDLSLVDRMQLALTGELARRQEQLRLAGNLGSIADYQAARARGAPLEPLPYLIVVVDEFGELLAAKPDFVDTFLTLARLGRSLGVHLLLATQRLDEGRIRGLEPHLRYRLCLRTFTAEESRAVLSNADAFELPSLPGLGYLRVDREQSRFKAAICGSARPAQADLGDGSRDQLAPSSLLRPLSLGGASSPDGQPAAARSRADDLQALVRLAGEAAGSRARLIWTAPLPAELTLGGLRELIAVQADSAADAIHEQALVAVGLADWPERQAKEAVSYRPAGAGGNLGVAGAPRTGKSTLLQTLVLALAATAGPDQRQFYCLDLGGGSLFELDILPHVGAVIGRGETEATARLFRELRALLDERASARQARRAGALAEAWPDIFLVVDNVGQLRQSAPDLEPELIELATAGLPFGLHVLLSANRWLDVRPQLLDALGTRWELRLADPSDSLAGRQAASRVPADLPGRGLTRDGHMIQAVLPELSAEPAPGGLAEAVAMISEAAGGRRAPAIAPLPLRAGVEDVARLALVAGSLPPSGDGRFLLGISEFRSRPVEVDLARAGSRLLVYGDSGSGRTTLLRRITSYLRQAASEMPGGGEIALGIVDPGRGLLDLADGPGVIGYAANVNAAEKLALRLAEELRPRVAPESAGVAELRGRWWSGPKYFLIVDDYDLLLGQMGGPFTALTDLLAQGADIGFGVVLTRRVAGSQRTSYEQFGQRLREIADAALILSGQPDEGPLAGGVSARPWPPGRGMLVSGRARPQLIQCCLDPEPAWPGEPGAPDGAGAGATGALR